jgi:hypothetical protein
MTAAGGGRRIRFTRSARAALLLAVTLPLLAGCFGGGSSAGKAPPTKGTSPQEPAKQESPRNLVKGALQTQASAVLRQSAAGSPRPPKEPPGLDKPCKDDFRHIKGQGLSCHIEGGLWKVKLRDGATVITHGPDLAPSLPAGVTYAEATANASLLNNVTQRQPVCAANNPHGNYYHVAIIAWPSDETPDKTADSLRSDIAKVDGALYQAAVESGSPNGADYVYACDSSGRVRVDQVQVPTPSYNADFDSITSDLRQMGYSRTNEKYVVYYTDTVAAGYRGEGNLGGVNNTSDETDSSTNTNNSGPSYALIYDSVPDVIMHENGHTLGAVQPNAGHSTAAGHCWEDFDIMCYDDDGSNMPASGMAQDCSASHFDCGHSDYFDAKIGAGQGAGAGDYLDIDWNIGDCYVRWIVNRACTSGDTVAPVVTAPLHTVALNWQLGTSVIPVLLTWSGTDSGGSGVASYSLWQSTDGSNFGQVQLPSTLTTSITSSLDPGHSYRFVVGAVDGAGNRSSWSYGPSFTVTAYQEASSAISYGGSWTRVAWSSAYGGYESYATAAGATARLSFTGQSIALVSPVFSTSGRADIFLDGSLFKTIDLYSSSLLARKVVFAARWSAVGSHSITVKVAGTAGRPRVDLDSLIVLG